MKVIDGALLEGGGQIVRAAVALASLTGEEIRVIDIRAARSPPGLAAQHVAAVKAAAAVCHARMTGVTVGSRECTFLPGTPERRTVAIDIGTAGSIPLLLSAWLPQALFTGGVITVTGGTGAINSPTIDYFNEVFLGYLRAHGAAIDLVIERRGYYPVGGGSVTVTVLPSDLAPLGSCTPVGAGIISASSGLPDHVASRQAAAAAAVVGDLPVRIVRQAGPGVGSTCTVWSPGHGGSAVGKRGLPAEEVGRMAAEAYRDGLGCDCDSYLFDQLLIYLAISGGRIRTSRLTLHAETMIHLLEQFGYSLSLTFRDGCVEASA
ncbi:hypothetical protein RJ53_08560 [Methanocalculus chunghsingensis]|uniref:RNA 3'-terminal phosphate cyclase n=1 Tax=Methanocalculus chunghsingensis TaxID=156457 RepID=A0A8J7W8P5_9EURY|nr:RNA 3'-terminal phosphate cyclase [Methanocalculus chunghsingensis]MBR1369533.1 hypothetical protein [Methanocalculus chunghsingensis]